MRGRRTTLAAAAALVLVAAGGTAWVLSSRDDARDTRRDISAGIADGVVPDRADAVVALPSSGWKPDDVSRAAALSAVLAVDDRGCVTTRSAEDPSRVSGPEFALLWPAGFQARREADGRVSILDGDGRVVLRDGDAFEVGGAAGPTAPASTSTCVAAATETWSMESIPTRVKHP